MSGFSMVYAAGDYTGRNDLYLGTASILTKGKNATVPDPSNLRAKYFKEGVKDNPLGVKFVSPSDVGVELVLGTGVVRFGTIKESSPMTTALIEKGDRVVTLNGVTIETAADFRRQLRESLLWGTGLFEIKRGDQTFLRLVKFAEPPKK